MITTVDDTKRLIRVTEGNIRNHHISVTGLRGFLPTGCVGASKKTAGRARAPITIRLEGLAQTVVTDVGRDAKTGLPRRQLRARAWLRKFYEYHSVRAGDLLELERLGDGTYFLRVAGHSTIRVAEFFAGIGLVRLGLEQHGFKTVFANDIDPEKLEMYSANFPTESFHLGDIHKLIAADIPDCDIVTASFPCTDLSIAGEMNGIHSGESSAFWGLVQLLHDMKQRRPRVVLLENVPGFLMSHEGKDFKSAAVALNRLGYVVDAFFLDAARFVPQSRMRLFVVGRLGLPSEYPFGLAPSCIRPTSLVDFITAHPSIHWNIRPLPEPPATNSSLASVIEDLPDIHPSWWNDARRDYFMS